MSSVFWGQSSETLLTRQRQLLAEKKGASSLDEGRGREAGDARAANSMAPERGSLDSIRSEFNFAARHPHQSVSNNDEGRAHDLAASRQKAVMRAPSLRGSASVDDFLATSGPRVEASVWESSMGVDKLRAQQKHIRKLQSGLAPAGPDSTLSEQPSQQKKPDAFGQRSSKPSYIDPHLLEEAFRYGQEDASSIVINTKSFSPEASLSMPVATRASPFSSAAQRMLLAHGPSRGPALEDAAPRQLRAVPGSLNAKKKTKLKKRRKKTTAAKKTPQRVPFSTSPRRPEFDGAGAKAAKSQAELEAMVADLSSGSLVHSLRRQLEESQRSLDSSNTFIQAATHEWFRHG